MNLLIEVARISFGSISKIWIKQNKISCLELISIQIINLQIFTDQAEQIRFRAKTDNLKGLGVIWMY